VTASGNLCVIALAGSMGRNMYSLAARARPSGGQIARLARIGGKRRLLEKHLVSDVPQMQRRHERGLAVVTGGAGGRM
jgi:hypothetical protein